MASMEKCASVIAVWVVKPTAAVVKLETVIVYPDIMADNVISWKLVEIVKMTTVWTALVLKGVN